MAGSRRYDHPVPEPAPQLNRAVARRFLVLRHLLAPPRSLSAEPASVLRVMDRLGSLQFDPLEIAGRNHDLVLLARVSGYRREWTDHWLYEDRRLYETYNKGLSIVPVAEMPWYRLTWDRDRAEHEGGAFDEHAPLVEELLGRIRDGGPLLPRDIGPRAAIDWYWRPTNQVRAILEALAEAGILGISRREGNLRVYDLVERLFPADVLAERRPEWDQRRHRLLSRYRAGGLLGTGGQSELWLGTAAGTSGQSGVRTTSERSVLRGELVERGVLVPVTVEGFNGVRFVIGAERQLLAQATREVAAGEPPGGREPGVAFLAPLDPFCWDRDLLRRLFDFDYVWEVYVPAARRRWATTSCRSCTAIASSAASSPGSSAGPRPSESWDCGGRTTSIRSMTRASPRPSRPRSRPIASSAVSAASSCRGPFDIDRS